MAPFCACSARSQPCRPSHRRGRARGKRQAFTAPFALHFLEPAPEKDVRHRHRLPSLQNPSPPHRHDRDRGRHQEDSQSHGTAHLCAQTLARTSATLAIWWRRWRLAELTGRRPGRDGVDLPACSKTPRQAPDRPAVENRPCCLPCSSAMKCRREPGLNRQNPLRIPDSDRSGRWRRRYHYSQSNVFVYCPCRSEP